MTSAISKRWYCGGFFTASQTMMPPIEWIRAEMVKVAVKPICSYIGYLFKNFHSTIITTRLAVRPIKAPPSTSEGKCSPR